MLIMAHATMCMHWHIYVHMAPGKQIFGQQPRPTTKIARQRTQATPILSQTGTNTQTDRHTQSHTQTSCRRCSLSIGILISTWCPYCPCPTLNGTNFHFSRWAATEKRDEGARPQLLTAFLPYVAPYFGIKCPVHWRYMVCSDKVIANMYNLPLMSGITPFEPFFPPVWCFWFTGSVIDFFVNYKLLAERMVL